jgi:hypothetical protein
MNFRTFSLIIFVVAVFRFAAYSGEGMWIPMLLEQLNEQEMIDMGMRITAEDIYSINNSSMKDAIVLFGRGCTAEIISNQGLLLTNHHCGYGQIQKHSSVENDYLTDGFWAMSREEELPNPGLTVTMMVSMEEVTAKVLDGVTDDMSNVERKGRIRENSLQIITDFEKDSEYKAIIKPFFTGNQFYMIITQTFRDIRLVGAPPSNIGKFGGDSDNWMWPRHTGDFSLFRIYVGPDGKPADYSENNVPYEPKYFFPISLKGVDEGDFTFVFGYPARTNEYLPSDAIKIITEVRNPANIKLRETRLEIFSAYADKDPKVRIQYATKHARVSNAWKKWIGESGGIKRMNGVEMKEAYETEFSAWANGNSTLKGKYGSALPAMEKVYEEIIPYQLAYDYYREAGLAVELVSFAGKFNNLYKMSMDENTDPALLDSEKERLQKSVQTFFKDYYQPIDEEVMVAVMQIYSDEVEAPFSPAFFELVDQKYGGDWNRYKNYVYEKSIFNKQEELIEFITDYKPKDAKKLMKDPAFSIFKDLNELYTDGIKPGLVMYSYALDSLQRIYMAGQMEMQPDRRFYPDANFTLRVTYGNVKGYKPEDAVNYKHYTTLEGIIEKEDPDIYDYVVEDRLKELYDTKDYGQYANKEGEMCVAFVATNHTTGGNSGSPVLDADGYLVGVNFDRCWEGTMSDLMYDPDVCRNISLDVRYFLFIVDKFAGAGYLLNEMKLVK